MQLGNKMQEIGHNDNNHIEWSSRENSDKKFRLTESVCELIIS